MLKILSCSSIVSLCLLLLASGCKPSAIAFKPSRNLDTSFFTNITGIIRDKINDDGSKGKIKKIHVYEAKLENITVERDAVAENKLLNTESKEEVLDDVTVYGYNQLYLFRIITTSPQDEDLFVFMASTFNKGGQCVKLGPAYMGKIRMDEMQVTKELSFQKRNDSAFYLANNKTRKITFFLDAELNNNPDKNCKDEEADPVKCRLRITKIINKDLNKIGGEKFLIYNTAKVFGDENALVFVYTHTIKK